MSENNTPVHFVLLSARTVFGALLAMIMLPLFLAAGIVMLDPVIPPDTQLINWILSILITPVVFVLTSRFWITLIDRGAVPLGTLICFFPGLIFIYQIIFEDFIGKALNLIMQVV